MTLQSTIPYSTRYLALLAKFLHQHIRGKHARLIMLTNQKSATQSILIPIWQMLPFDLDYLIHSWIKMHKRAKLMSRKIENPSLGPENCWSLLVCFKDSLYLDQRLKIYKGDFSSNSTGGSLSNNFNNFSLSSLALGYFHKNGPNTPAMGGGFIISWTNFERYLFCFFRLFLHRGGFFFSPWLRLYYQVSDKILRIGLLSSVNDIFWEGKASNTGPSNHTVMAWWGVGHLHGWKL